ncbi:MAG: PaaI family thioesterase [Flavobacteriaceae bacterium]|nr:PaaI family thioesterase [Flavobacteriaceae bacterium]
MINEFNKYLDFHKNKGGTGKIFNYKFIEYKKGFLKLEGEFNSQTLNPNQSVQGGQMTSMLDDVTSLLLIYESKGTIYPSSTNLHSHHHRPLFLGKVIAIAEIIKQGKNIATVKGEIYNSEGKLTVTLMHTVYLIKTEFNVEN